MKPDERQFLLKIWRERPSPASGAPRADEIGVALGIPLKRVHYLLGKWDDKGWWEYGVSLRTGWLTDSGLDFGMRLDANARLEPAP